MVDQPANNAPNFAATENEPSVKFAAHGTPGSWFQTHGKTVSNRFAKIKVEAIIAFV